MLFSKKAFKVALTLSSLIHEGQSFTSIELHNQQNYAAPSSFLSIPRGGFATSLETKPSSSPKSLRMSASSEAIDLSGGGSTGGGTATIPNEIFNLVKNIVGAGVLSLPAGVAAFGNAPSAVIPAVALITIIGGMSGYCFSLIGRVCSYTGANSYREAWEKTVGEKTSWIPATACTFMTMSAVLAYSMILADTFKMLAASAGYTITRTSSLFGITGFVLFPLCLLKNLASLAPFSLLGIIGMGYTTLAMALRYFGGAYSLPAGKFVADVAKEFQPSFGSTGAAGVLSPNSFILICMLSTAYMAHFNAPKFYTELKDNTIKRYNKVVSTSFGISIALFASIAVLGFLTFGSNASGLILNNYATNDILASATRIAVAASIVFSYPLAFSGLRDGVIDLLKIPSDVLTNFRLDKITFALLSMITYLALKVKDLTLVLSLGGATLGNSLIYVFPALMFRGAVKKMDKPSDSMKTEVKGATGAAVLGVVMGIIGSVMAIKSAVA